MVIRSLGVATGDGNQPSRYGSSRDMLRNKLTRARSLLHNKCGHNRALIWPPIVARLICTNHKSDLRLFLHSSICLYYPICLFTFYKQFYFLQATYYYHIYLDLLFRIFNMHMYIDGALIKFKYGLYRYLFDTARATKKVSLLINLLKSKLPI